MIDNANDDAETDDAGVDEPRALVRTFEETGETSTTVEAMPTEPPRREARGFGSGLCLFFLWGAEVMEGCQMFNNRIWILSEGYARARDCLLYTFYDSPRLTPGNRMASSDAARVHKLPRGAGG